MMPPAAATVSTARTVVSAITSGVTLALATTSPGSTGCSSKRVKTDMPSCTFTSVSAAVRMRSRPRRVAASVHCPPM
jgi:hypothetical protein